MTTLTQPPRPFSSEPDRSSRGRARRARTIKILALLFVLLAVIVGSVRNPNFWSTPDQRGDALFREGKFADAAKVYTDPRRIGVAQYRNGDFESAAKTFARVPGADGAYNQGNAWLMHGKYDDAISSYDRALSFRPGWPEASDNKALAAARRDKLTVPDELKTPEPPEEKPDEIVFDKKGENRKGPPQELGETEMSDEQLRATWLRRVQTTPGDFLKAKFAYQTAHAEQKGAKETKEGEN